MGNAAVHREYKLDILLVEDNPGDIRLAEEGCKASPVESTVHVVSDGERALEFLFQRGKHEDAPASDLVLLDLNLPRMDGHTVLGEVKGHPVRRRIPVVVVTSSNAEEDLVAAYDNHANLCVIKPSTASGFIEMISHVLETWFEFGRFPARGL